MTYYKGIYLTCRDTATVNIIDAIVLPNAFYSVSGSSNWNPDADINGDIVNILDGVMISNSFKETGLY